MKIEIWSDVMCPFCYIGKRHLENALKALPFQQEVDIEWKSYQLNPEYQNTSGETTYDYLARAKGMTPAQAKQLTGNVVEMAEQAGLHFDFDRSIPANSFDAHRLIHLAKANGKQDEAEEALFRAHFMDGKDIADKATLSAIGQELGLTAESIERLFSSNDYAEAVQYDLYESRQIGIRGVPYFVFDRKYALSGAQPVETFTAALSQSYNEWKVGQDNNAVCDDDGCAI